MTLRRFVALLLLLLLGGFSVALAQQQPSGFGAARGTVHDDPPVRARTSGAGAFPRVGGARKAIILGSVMGLLGCALPLGSEFQTGAARPEFEVASVKASPWFGSGAVSFNRTVGPAGIDFAGITAKELIVWAYGIKGYQVSGPGWISGEWFDVVAKASGPTPEDQMRLMGRSLLASRFRLQSHTETKLLPVYELVVGKSGLKLHEADPAGGPRYTPGRRGILAKHVSLSRFAELLSNKTDRPVVDKTAIEGFFDIDIEFTPDTGLAPDNELSPSVFAAVQQLGLKLEPHKASIEVLVVDRVERPSQN